MRGLSYGRAKQVFKGSTGTGGTVRVRPREQELLEVLPIAYKCRMPYVSVGTPTCRTECKAFGRDGSKP